MSTKPNRIPGNKQTHQPVNLHSHTTSKNILKKMLPGTIWCIVILTPWRLRRETCRKKKDDYSIDHIKQPGQLGDFFFQTTTEGDVRYARGMLTFLLLHSNTYQVPGKRLPIYHAYYPCFRWWCCYKVNITDGRHTTFFFVLHFLLFFDRYHVTYIYPRSHQTI